ncbi:hypothetical protein HYH02_003621 [Chlamydomonas schloesseri]|uniref:Uncharacterized protein n=1 Tax=Chlamydomonas schloesseri TaxID=2026947 RepID=A0A835WSM2_9CHLO|nr:hypothetical protein HYH02_003621 [Chlamydomonas schloesseri]|eukprot:KAG2451845.1 hypothetical protein HYH02_003621 [Chlamydomonas schloesseri]
MRSPDDSPLRDGNRDRLMGLLTERAAKTLAYYLLETNHNMHNWMNRFIKDNPIPRDGNWDDVSGDSFLRKLLSMPMEEASPWGRDELFHNASLTDVDPRSIAQRIMEIRTQLALEFVQDLKYVAEDNKLLQLETLQASLLSTDSAIADGSAAARQAATNAPGGSGSPSGASSPSGSSTPGGVNSRPRDGDGEAARMRMRAERNSKDKAKKSVLPPSGSTPSNWRMRLEVEAQVHGDDPASPSAPASVTGIPDNTQTGIISPIRPPPAASAPPAVPAASDTPAAASSAQPSLASSSGPPTSSSSSSSSSGAAAAPPPLHPEVAEMLPLIRSRPSEALTPDVAAMLSSLALMSNGQLHPDIVSALRDAVAGGARLHPEMAELLRIDLDSSISGSGSASSASSASGSSSSGPAGAVVGSAGSGVGGGIAPRSSPGPSGPAVAAASAAAAAAAAASSSSSGSKPQVEVAESPAAVEAKQAKQEEDVEDAIAQLQNDSCLHSDDE